MAARFNPIIRAFDQRLCQAGKAKKGALTACVRKLLVIFHAMLTHRRPWHQGGLGLCGAIGESTGSTKIVVPQPIVCEEL